MIFDFKSRILYSFCHNKKDVKMGDDNENDSALGSAFKQEPEDTANFVYAAIFNLHYVDPSLPLEDRKVSLTFENDTVFKDYVTEGLGRVIGDSKTLQADINDINTSFGGVVLMSVREDYPSSENNALIDDITDYFSSDNSGDKRVIIYEGDDKQELFSAVSKVIPVVVDLYNGQGGQETEFNNPVIQ